ncbi:MAG: hypothetical protein ACI9TH_001125 [Kiritimatiellia bacterium]|jgi:uncharacterized protein
MEILIKDYSLEPRQLQGELDPDVYDLEEFTEIKAILPIRYDFMAQVVGLEFLVTGSLTVDVGLDCVRCGEFFSTTFHDSAFLRAFEISDTTDYVDLMPDIRDSVLLGLPSFALCSSECKGLCAVCGTNLNTGVCSCEVPPVASAWGALDGLEIRQED